MKKAEASSYFAVEILYEGIFGHVTTFKLYLHMGVTNHWTGLLDWNTGLDY